MVDFPSGVDLPGSAIAVPEKFQTRTLREQRRRSLSEVAMRALVPRVLAIGLLSAFLFFSLNHAKAQGQPSPSAEVTYKSGVLTINAKDCTLKEILDALQKQTGITVESPDIEGGARMIAHFGPDTPDKVLDKLFYGTKYNYILVGASDNPDVISRIVLMEKNTTAENPPPPAPDPAPADAVASEQKPQDSADGDKDKDKDASGDAKEQAKNDTDKEKDPNAENADKDKKDGKSDTKDASAKDTGMRMPNGMTLEEVQKVAAAIADNAAPAARTDVELTEDVLKKLPKLPEGIPSALYGLYPEIVNGGLEAVGLQPPSMFPQAANPVNGGNAGSFQPGQLGTGPQQPRRDPNDWTIPPGLPPLPPGIDPKIWLLYPPNLLDLIRSAPPPQQTGH